MNFFAYFLPLVGFLCYICSATSGGPIQGGNVTSSDELFLEEMEDEPSFVFTYRYFQRVYGIRDFNLYMVYLQNYIKILFSHDLRCDDGGRLLKHLQGLVFYVKLGKTLYQYNLPSSSPWRTRDGSRLQHIEYLEFLKTKIPDRLPQQSSELRSYEIRVIDTLLDDLKSIGEAVSNGKSLVDRPPPDLETFAEIYNNNDTAAFVTYVTNLPKIFGWLLSKKPLLRATIVLDRYKESLLPLSKLYPLVPLTHLTGANAPAPYLQGLKEQLERGDLTNGERRSEHEMISETLNQVIQTESIRR